MRDGWEWDTASGVEESRSHPILHLVPVPCTELAAQRQRCRILGKTRAAVRGSEDLPQCLHVDVSRLFKYLNEWICASFGGIYCRVSTRCEVKMASLQSLGYNITAVS